MNGLTIVVGAPRSGAWLVAKAIAACGAWLGPTDPSSFDNRPIADDIIKPFLRGISADPACVWPLPDLASHDGAVKTVAVAWRSRVLRSLAVQGAVLAAEEGSRVCVVSHASLHLWPIWAQAFGDDVSFVVVRRDQNEIERSCVKSGVGSFASWTQERWIAWHAAHALAMQGLRESGVNAREVWPSTLVRDGKIDDVRGLVDWLGLEWNRDAVSDAVTPDLWRAGNFAASI